MIHVEIPGDESGIAPGSLEDSFSSVFSEHFSPTQKKNQSVCQLWEMGFPLHWSELSLRPTESSWLFVVLDARRQKPALAGSV